MVLFYRCPRYLVHRGSGTGHGRRQQEPLPATKQNEEHLRLRTRTPKSRPAWRFCALGAATVAAAVPVSFRTLGRLLFGCRSDMGCLRVFSFAVGTGVGFFFLRMVERRRKGDEAGGSVRRGRGILCRPLFCRSWVLGLGARRECRGVVVWVLFWGRRVLVSLFCP